MAVESANMNETSLFLSNETLHNDTEVRQFVVDSNCLSNAPNQRKRLAQRMGASFTIMLVGESGLGKRTFVRSLFGSEFNVTSSVDHNRAVPTRQSSSEVCDVHRTAEIEVHEAVVLENNFETRLTAIFTPGFGDYTNNSNTWVPLASYIDSQHQHYMCQEEQPDRTQLTDNRVHACFYFLPPTNRVSDLDWISMKELGKRVNLIPVIAKADSMVREDLVLFKDLIREGISDREIRVWSPLLDPEQLDVTSWPFGVVSSDEEVMLPDGKYGFGRKYRWGVVDIHDPLHSDFELLRDFVFENNMLSLIDSTTDRFYRKQKHRARLVRLCHALNLNNQSPEAVRQKLASSKLVPEDRASVAYTRNAVCSPSSTNSRNSVLDVVEEVGMAMSGLELLSTVSNYGLSFLSNEFQEHDVVLKQRIMGLKAQFDDVARYQENRFDAQAAELEKLKNELSLEIAMMSERNKALSHEIHDLEYRRKK